MLFVYAIILSTVFGLCTTMNTVICFVCNSKDRADCNDNYIREWRKDLKDLSPQNVVDWTRNDCECCTKVALDGTTYRDCGGSTNFFTTSCSYSWNVYTCASDLCNAAKPTVCQSNLGHALIISMSMVFMLLFA